MSLRICAASTVVALSVFAACSSSQETSLDNSEGAASTGGVLTVPEPGSTNNAISASDQALIVSAWKKAKADYYDTQNGYYGFSSGTVQWTKPPVGVAPAYSEVASVPCPAYYSDLVCHFYQHMPSYTNVIPNIRGCFSRLSNGSLQIPVASALGYAPNNAPRAGTYAEAWDYCMYQDYDAVAGRTPGTYDVNLINQNKAAGNEIGVLRFLAPELRPVFQFIMYTWYEPNTYLQADQQAILAQIYPAGAVPPPRTGLSTHPNAATIVPSMKAYFADAPMHPPAPAAHPPQPPPPPPPPPPPLNALPGTLYPTNTGSGVSSWGGNYLAGFPVQLAANANLQQFGLVTTAAQANVMMALYTDAGGKPGTLVASTAATALIAGDQRIAPLAPTALAAGTYWVMGQFDGPGGAMKTDQGQPSSYISNNFSSGIPAIVGTLTSYPSFRLDFYIVAQ